MSKIKPCWDGDKCDRKPIGDYLYKLVLRRYSKHSGDDSKALCVAIDAGWGAGKTFFVRHWSVDIENAQHPVVRFDAWKSDLSEDPLLAFLAQLQSDLTPWLKKLPVADKIKKDAATKLRKIVRQGTAAAVPVFGLAIKGAADHFAPGIAKAVSDVFAGEVDGDQQSESESEETPAETIRKLSGPAVKKFLELALKTQRDRQAAIEGLKDSIAELLSFLQSQRLASLPLFVFVDELDRCRPDYAVRLLEGVKHLFDASGVCFVFSTNTVQLAASMQAIYGANFDSAHYLKRFFNLEFLLPRAEVDGFVRQLAEESDMRDRGFAVVSGLPEEGVAIEGAQAIASSFAVVANAFQLSLRSQRQVFAMADSATVGLEPNLEGRPVLLHVLYLFFLAALLHSQGVVAFDSFAVGGTERKDLLLKAAVKGDVKYTVVEARGEVLKKRLQLVDLFIRYSDLSRKTRKELVQESRGGYPHSLASHLLNEPGKEGFTSIRTYAALIRNAGHIAAR